MGLEQNSVTSLHCGKCGGNGGYHYEGCEREMRTVLRHARSYLYQRQWNNSADVGDYAAMKLLAILEQEVHQANAKLSISCPSS